MAFHKRIVTILKKGLFKTIIFILLFTAAAFASEKLLGDESDGSRSAPVHLIPLMDEQSYKIAPDDSPLLPFSMKNTCGACHSYEKISKGRHFNAIDPNVPAGRVGQPWIYVDPGTATQLPLSYRSWPGTFKPGKLGISPWKFTDIFGRYTPGGGASELETEDYDEIMRQMISGKLEINCLACHNSNPHQDHAEFASQMARQNYRWASTASCEFASVEGSAKNMPDTYDPLMPAAVENKNIKPPTVKYREGAFDHKNKVLFDVGGKIPANRCYACHSNKVIDGNSACDTDVHLASGMNCVDCHKSNLGHQIVRGYEWESSENPSAAVSSCKGCHMGTDSLKPSAGRFGAPYPEHKGIPPVHFEKLSCTACHSGPWPLEKTGFVKTSRAHGLGMHGVNKSDEVLPHIITPVFAEQSDGKIAPHNLVWPTYWADLADRNVMPIDLKTLESIVKPVIAQSSSSSSGSWKLINDQQITKALGLLASQGSLQGKPVYIAGGKVHQLDENGKLVSRSHSAAKPYLWPIAHDVRPASQSLGIGSCGDCHSTDAPFSFGRVSIDSPITSEQLSVDMIEFQDVNPVYMKLFAMSFVFRPLLKIVALASSAVLAFVLLLYGLKALKIITKIVAEQED
ncbi:MAG: cytochrome c3 family protein [Planctomycetota bacterium]|jgi:cytochrome c1